MNLGKVIENLAAIGYDNNNMHLAGYDWRLGFADLEVRDQHFTRMKNTIELAKMYTGEKAVLVGHSMGSNVIYYFLQWVESEQGGKGGPNWVNDYIHTFVNIAGPMLGVPKTLSSLLSGEQRETVQPVANYVLEQFFSRRERTELFRTWGGVASMMPKGGNYVWGDESSAPDDIPHIKHSYGPIISFSQGESVTRNLTLEDALELLFKTGDESFKSYFTRLYSLGFSNDNGELKRDDPTTWANPLDSQLPNAPNMKIYCLHGVGKLTERQYYYTADQVEPENAAAAGAGESKSSKILPKELLNPNIYIDTNVHQADYNISSGIVESDGDGTVPLISLGYMCSSGWKKPLYNPSGIKIVTREFEHELTKFDLRGGVKTADHVDILGNYALTEDLLRIVSGKDEDLDDIIHSKILEYSANVDKRIEANTQPKPSGSWW
ncbi:phospholipid:diacylglycerol acyltransferase [Basidiobolus ranarum]|uniref:Phospholipid:diacylglycerol acyltransferase n=1 Tax=Basidiobolus ranarum TaxID=34480 RepID=A0ABR2X278_9FUNG